jgi:UDP-GlcNAc:undecaprenyl-phosphate GlcNAc-1-phosphate transferase
VALRLISHHERHKAGWIAFLMFYAIVCLAASIYLVYVLEIFKFRRLRTIELRRDDPDTSEHEIDEAVRRDIETGEFEKVDQKVNEKVK